MRNGIAALTEREKETLRLLVSGHDAKSISRDLGLSVHTVNERLRDARRKLDVSSSREAARLLAEAERGHPHSVGDKDFGVSDDHRDVPFPATASGSRWAGHRLVWLGGGMLIMSLLIAAVALTSAFHGNAAENGATTSPVALVADAPAPASLASAQGWLALVDGQDWEASWRQAATMFQSQITASQWSATIQPVRGPLGPVTSRRFATVTKASTLPGAPSGEYETLQFQTNFAHKQGAVETVILAREPGGWKVAGYFIR